MKQSNYRRKWKKKLKRQPIGKGGGEGRGNTLMRGYSPQRCSMWSLQEVSGGSGKKFTRLLAGTNLATVTARYAKWTCRCSKAGKCHHARVITSDNDIQLTVSFYIFCLLSLEIELCWGLRLTDCEVPRFWLWLIRLCPWQCRFQTQCLSFTEKKSEEREGREWEKPERGKS